MARHSIQVSGQTVWVTDDDPAPPELGWWAVLRTRVIDEITEAPPLAPPRIIDGTPRFTPRIGSDGLCGLIARPRDVSAAMVEPGALRATIQVEGYLPQVLDAAIDNARRQLPGGAAAGVDVLTITPPEPADRPQFQPGRGVLLERPAPAQAEQFTLHAHPLTAPGVNQVPLVDAVSAARSVGAHAIGVPIVLADQRLHRAEPALIRGRALRQTAPGSVPVAAPSAHIGIRGVWWTQREIAANSAPPHPARIVAFGAPLANPHATAATLEQVVLAPDGVARANGRRVDGGATTIDVLPWSGLAPAGGDVFQIEADNSAERELFISAGFDTPLDPASPARIRLRAPLAFAHAAGAPIVRSALMVTALGVTDREAIPGDRVLFASSLAGLATLDLLRIGGAGPEAELRFVCCLPTHDGVAFAHEATLAADGSFSLPPIARVAQAQFFTEHAGHPPQLPFDLVPEPGRDNSLQILFTP